MSQCAHVVSSAVRSTPGLESTAAATAFMFMGTLGTPLPTAHGGSPPHPGVFTQYHYALQNVGFVLDLNLLVIFLNHFSFLLTQPWQGGEADGSVIVPGCLICRILRLALHHLYNLVQRMGRTQQHSITMVGSQR